MKYITQLHDWLTQRTPRDRFLIFIFVLVWIYAIWYLFFMRNVLHEKVHIQNQIETKKAEKLNLETQIKVRLINVKNKSFSKKLNEQEEVTNKIKAAQVQLDKLRPMLTTKDDRAEISKELLNQKGDKVVLNVIDTKPPIAWEPRDLDPADLSNIVTTDMYQYDIVIEFQADYFSTIDYLKKIEKIPRNIYWDSMNYKVTTYPMADVTLKLHVLDDEKT